MPLRAAPTIAEGQIFVITFDSRIFALDATTGEINWNFEGGIETTGLLGAASPAYDNGTVVVPFASGELYAFRAANGQQAWSDQLVRRRLYSSLTSLTDINAFPVLDRGVVSAASYSGNLDPADPLDRGRFPLCRLDRWRSGLHVAAQRPDPLGAPPRQV